VSGATLEDVFLELTGREYRAWRCFIASLAGRRPGGALAGDVYRLHRLRWVMETSMLKTLAGQHRSSMSKMAARHKAKVATWPAASPATSAAASLSDCEAVRGR
jgi:hypothetical protein